VLQYRIQLNDASELTYGLDQVRLALGKMSPKEPLVSMVEQQGLATLRLVEVYAACFCPRGDLLNQWHGYGRQGGGYSIGLDTKELQGILAGTEWALYQVLYQPSKQRQLIQDEVTAAGTALEAAMRIRSLSSDEEAALSRWAINELLSELGVAIAIMKDPAFRGEQEWRMVRYQTRSATPSNDVSFRVSGDLMVPFIAKAVCFQDSRVLPVSQVIIGPTVDRLAERSVRTLLQQHDMSTVNGRKVDVKRSTLPLQSFV
jgi:hypothetical protein